MINLWTWARRWNIPGAAVNDLRLQMGVDPSQPEHGVAHGKSESWVASIIRLRFAREGALLWRNNVGAMQGEDGRVVRYGLANESKVINQKVKSSDLIGIRPVVITQDMVGSTIGQFIAVETKKPGWEYKATPREVAQAKFLSLVMSKGGIGFFTNGVDDTVKPD